MQNPRDVRPDQRVDYKHDVCTYPTPISITRVLSFGLSSPAIERRASRSCALLVSRERGGFSKDEVDW